MPIHESAALLFILLEEALTKQLQINNFGRQSLWSMDRHAYCRMLPKLRSFCIASQCRIRDYLASFMLSWENWGLNNQHKC